MARRKKQDKIKEFADRNSHAIIEVMKNETYIKEFLICMRFQMEEMQKIDHSTPAKITISNIKRVERHLLELHEIIDELHKIILQSNIEEQGKKIVNDIAEIKRKLFMPTFSTTNDSFIKSVELSLKDFRIDREENKDES